MVYEIYSLGDANYLAVILNAVAAMGGDGTYQSLLSYSLLMGVLIIALQAIMNGGGRFDIQVFLLSIVVYQVIFIPRASVMIFDSYTGSARQVDNVPFGLAWVGSTLNLIGIEITRKMELAFSTPQMTTNGFAGALSTLLNAQRIDGLGIADYGCTNAPSPTATYISLTQQDRACSVTQAVSTYIGDCVVRAIGHGQRTADDIYRAERVIDALQTDYITTFTRIPLGGAQPMPPGGWEYTCKDGYDVIKNRMSDGGFTASFNEFLKGRFGEQDPTAALGQAMTALSNASYNAQDFAINMAMRESVANGLYLNRNDAIQGAAMLTAGAAQRNVQWSAEATLFSKLIRPLITFFEGMMYATAPFIAFLLGLGSYGFKVALKYLYLPIWVSMWLPVMAICNLYVNMIAQGRMAAFETGSAAAYTSMTGSMVMFSSLTDWLGTASMLASSVPALTMSLLFGGAVAMSSLAGRLQSGDYTNEKLAAPDAVSPSAALSVSPTAQTDRIAGARAFGGDRILPSVNVGSEFSMATESSRQALEKASTTATSGVAEALKQIDSKGLTFATASQLGSSISNSTDDTLKSFYKQAMQDLSSTGFSQEQKDAIVGATILNTSAKASAQVSAGSGQIQQLTEDITNAVMSGQAVQTALPGQTGGTLGPAGQTGGTLVPAGQTAPGAQKPPSASKIQRRTAGFDVGADADASISGRASESREMAVANAVRNGVSKLLGAEFDDGVANTLSNKLVNGLTATGTETLGKTLQAEGASSASRQLQDVAEKSDIFKRTENLSTKLGTSTSLSGTDFAAMAQRNNAGLVIDSAAAASPFLARELQNEMQNPIYKEGGPGGLFQGNMGAQKAMAALRVAQRMLASGDAEQARLGSSLLGDLATIFGNGAPSGLRGTPGSGAYSNQDVAANAPTEDERQNLRNRVDNLPEVTQDPRPSTAALPQMVREQYQTVNSRVRPLDDDPNAQSAADRVPITRNADTNAAAVAAPERQRAFAAVTSGSDGAANVGPAAGLIMAAGSDLIGSTVVGLVKDVAEFVGAATGLAPGMAQESAVRAQAAMEDSAAQMERNGVPADLARAIVSTLGAYSLENAPAQVADMFGFGSGNGYSAQADRASALAGEYASQREYGKPYGDLDDEQKQEIDGFKSGFREILGNAAAQPESGSALLNNVQAYFFTSDTSTREAPFRQ